MMQSNPLMNRTDQFMSKMTCSKEISQQNLCKVSEIGNFDTSNPHLKIDLNVS